MNPTPPSSSRSSFLSNKPLLVGLVLLAVLLGAYLLLSNKDNSDVEGQGLDATGPAEQSIKDVSDHSFEYPAGWRELISSSGKPGDEGFVLQAARTNPGGTLVVTSGIVEISADYDVNTLPEPLIEALEDKVKNFKLIQQEVITAGDYDAVMIRYQETVLNSKQLQEHVLVVIPVQPDTTYYLNFRTAAQSFGTVRPQIDTITQRFAAYVAAQ